MRIDELKAEKKTVKIAPKILPQNKKPNQKVPQLSK
jgi:hypothetical protein